MWKAISPSIFFASWRERWKSTRKAWATRCKSFVWWSPWNTSAIVLILPIRTMSLVLPLSKVQSSAESPWSLSIASWCRTYSFRCISSVSSPSTLAYRTSALFPSPPSTSVDAWLNRSFSSAIAMDWRRTMPLFPSTFREKIWRIFPIWLLPMPSALFLLLPMNESLPSTEEKLKSSTRTNWRKSPDSVNYIQNYSLFLCRFI